MTAVEFIVEQLAKNGVLHSSDIARAKEMEKEQKIEFAEDYADQVMAGMNKRASEYYNETFKPQ